jgi:hypothetical protein
MRLVVTDPASLLHFSVTVYWKKIIPRQDESCWFQAIEKFSLAVSRLGHIPFKGERIFSRNQKFEGRLVGKDNGYGSVVARPSAIDMGLS